MALVPALSLTSRCAQLVLAILLLIGVTVFLIPSLETIRRVCNLGLRPSADRGPSREPRPDHPIDSLVRRADEQFAGLLQKEVFTLHDAAEAYRQRRGRQPPPDFDIWFAFAQNRSALIIEDFFDQIYHDLTPLWVVPAAEIRDQATALPHRVSIRGGKAKGIPDVKERPWVKLWRDMVDSVAAWLPDMDIPINLMDESRIVVPWEEMNEYMRQEGATRKVVPDAELKTTFASPKDVDVPPLKETERFDPEFEGIGPYWPMAVMGCPPWSPARKTPIETNFSAPPPLTGNWPEGSYMGYVQNWTLARSPCDNAHLQGLHGTFVEPVSNANSKKLFPLFGGSKLPMNNEILLPAAMYWADNPRYSGGAQHGQPWRKKKDAMIWRGVASGGRNRANNWTRFQRHRFVSMVNATAIRLAENGEEEPQSFVLPANNSYMLAAQFPSGNSESGIGDWLTGWSDAAVVHLVCFPDEGGPSKCSYTDKYFKVVKPMPMKAQYAYKYLPDIDGNSFSGRYRAFLYSTSLPIKATIYQEWHDSRLVPWKHYMPMDNTFVDFYGLMEYFLGNVDQGVEGHDDVAQSIAMGGKDWAEKVLRKEDMSVYVFRLLLEYARLRDDEREILGWREDGYG